MRTFILWLLMATCVQAQQLNDYQYVVVPTKFDFASSPNQYRLNTLTKMHLEKVGFIVYYDNDVLPREVAENNCKRLNADVTTESNMFNTRVTVHLRDCTNREIFKTEPGTSREKDIQAGYVEALKNAFASFEKVNYKYGGPSDLPLTSSTQSDEDASAALVLDARPIDNGYDLYLRDSSGSMYVFTILKSTDPNVYIAFQKSKQGVLIKKGGKWHFESYESGKLMSEQVVVNGLD